MKTTNVFNRKRVVAINSDVNDKFMPDMTINEIKKLLSKYILVEMKPSKVGEGKDQIKIVYIEAKHKDESVIMMVQVFDEENTKDIITALKIGAGVAQVMLSNPSANKYITDELYNEKVLNLSNKILKSGEAKQRGKAINMAESRLTMKRIFPISIRHQGN